MRVLELQEAKTGHGSSEYDLVLIGGCLSASDAAWVNDVLFIDFCQFLNVSVSTNQYVDVQVPQVGVQAFLITPWHYLVAVNQSDFEFPDGERFWFRISLLLRGVEKITASSVFPFTQMKLLDKDLRKSRVSRFPTLPVQMKLWTLFGLYD